MTVATTLGSASPPAPQGGQALYGYRVINVYPHDTRAFTQGLIFRDGVLYESTGRYGQSTLRKVELTTGKVLQQHAVDPKHFGEGLTEFRGKAAAAHLAGGSSASSTTGRRSSPSGPSSTRARAGG